MKNRNVCLIPVSTRKFGRTIYDDLKKEPRTIMYLRCPQTGIEIPITYKTEKERLEWKNLRKEIKEEILQNSSTQLN